MDFAGDGGAGAAPGAGVEGGSGEQVVEQVPGGAGVAAPTEISDDTLVRVPGQDQPVKYGELAKRLQGDYTRKTQEAAKIRAQYERERQEWQSQREQQEAYLKNAAAALLAQRGGNAQPGANILDKLSELPYLTGTQASEVLKSIIGPITGSIQQKDQVIQHLYNQVSKLTKTVQAISGERATSSFDSKIRGWVKEGGYPEEAVALAKEVYLAYEGDDLDDEFPEIFRTRWESLVNTFNKLNQQKVEAAKAGRGIFPGKGGLGRAGKPLGLTGKESAQQASDMLWEAMQAEERT